MLPVVEIPHRSEFIGKNKVYLKHLLMPLYNGYIPSNSILDKTITGLGATSCEIECDRDSIIIQPNLPVILGKKQQYPNKDRWDFPLFTIHHQSNFHGLDAYLSSKDIPYKKIITTPEGFVNKLIPYFESKHIEFYNRFFLLIDECDKTIEDAHYRKALTKTMKPFWLFKRKSMVSATPIMPSDPMFKNQEFKYVKVVPHFDYSVETFLYITNSILDCVKFTVNEFPKTTFCFFVNSITVIQNIIRVLDVGDKSKIFCSEISSKKLTDSGYTNHTNQIDINSDGYANIVQFNFFTSRFYSGVDIELKDIYPTIIAVTDCYFAPFTMLDPITNLKQIQGRFRNGTGFVYHITNIKRDIVFHTEDYIRNLFEGHKRTFKIIHTLYKNENNPAVKEAYRRDLKSINAHDSISVFNNELRFNYFNLDNEVSHENTRALYSDAKLLTQRYKDDPFFKVYLRFLDNFKNDDRERYIVKRLNRQEIRKEIYETYWKILSGELSGHLKDHIENYKINVDDGFILECSNYLEKETLEKYEYQQSKLEPIMDFIFGQETSINPILVKRINKTFKIGKRYSSGYIKRYLNEIIVSFKLDKKMVATDLSDYCQLSERQNIGKNDYKLPLEGRTKGYLIIDHLFK